MLNRFLFESEDPFQYKDVDFGDSSYNRGASATIGIENSDGSVGVQYSYNQASVSENMAILFSLSSSPAVPTAISGSTTSVEFTSGTLNGTVNPNGASTTVIFEYGTGANYGSSITATQSPLAGTTAQSVSARLTGLKAGMTYHFRITATNSVGTSNGPDKSFTTTAADVVYDEPGGSCGEIPPLMPQYTGRDQFCRCRGLNQDSARDTQ
jgi:hypothetical protein